MYESILSAVERFAAAYPVVFGLLITLVAVPALGSALSFADGWAAKRWPVAVAILRAVLPDPKRAAAIITARALESQKLPVPPEVRELSIRRIEKAAASERPPKLPPPLPLLCLAVALTACADLEPAKTAANATRDVGIAGADLLERVCAEPYAAAKTRADVAALDRLGCPEAATAYDDLRRSHALLVAVIRATEAGQCVGVSRSMRECNVVGAYVDLAKAASDWAAAVERIGGGS